MGSYILRRVLVTIPVMAIVALFVFSLLYIAPGDPAAVIAGDQATPADVERAFAALSKGGTVTMPVSETFFAKSFGMLTDRFGVPWMLICSLPA